MTIFLMTWMQNYVGHVLYLDKPYKDLESNFRNSTLRNLKKARKNGVKVEVENNDNAICEFYRLNCLTRRDHGLPPQPFSFFKEWQKSIGYKNKGFIISASYNEKVIASAVFLTFNKVVIYKYGASDKKYQYLRANNLIIGEAIRWSEANNFNEFHFGRTDVHHKGLLQFKRGWGPIEQEIRYYCYNLKMKKFVKKINEREKYSRLLSSFPIQVLRLLGKIAYRHIG